MVLPLHKTGQITVGNALRQDWLEVCPPVGAEVVEEEDIAGSTGRLALEANGLLGGRDVETFICGNPPYLGSKRQSPRQKEELFRAFGDANGNWRSLDYVAGWIAKAANYTLKVQSSFAFVTTNSVWQGQQVSTLWPFIHGIGLGIFFAHTAFRWRNLASDNAGVTVVIVGLTSHLGGKRRLYDETANGETAIRLVDSINAYLIPSSDVIVEKTSAPEKQLARMERGNSPTDGGFLILNKEDAELLELTPQQKQSFLRPFYGSDEIINGSPRLCLWIEDDQQAEAQAIASIAARISRVKSFRLASSKAATVKAAAWPHRFDERKGFPERYSIVVPIRSSENRPYLPVDLLSSEAVLSNTAFGIPDGPLWHLAIIASRLHLAWIATVCARLEMRFSYTNTIGWNTFPIQKLTQQDKSDLTRTAENILLVREEHFPATIADLYDPDTMPLDLRRAHEENDEVLERIYIGRRFRNDTERLEKLFDLYTKMTANVAPKGKGAKKGEAA